MVSCLCRARRDSSKKMGGVNKFLRRVLSGGVAVIGAGVLVHGLTSKRSLISTRASLRIRVGTEQGRETKAKPHLHFFFLG